MIGIAEIVAHDFGAQDGALRTQLLATVFDSSHSAIDAVILPTPRAEFGMSTAVAGLRECDGSHPR